LLDTCGIPELLKGAVPWLLRPFVVIPAWRSMKRARDWRRLDITHSSPQKGIWEDGEPHALVVEARLDLFKLIATDVPVVI